MQESDNRKITIEKELKFDIYFFVGLLLPCLVPAFLARKDELIDLYHTDPAFAVLKVYLGILVALWFAIWFIIIRKEIKYLRIYLIELPLYLRRSRIAPIIFPPLLSIAFGILFAFGLDLSVFIICIYSIYLITFIGDSLTIKVLSQDLLNNNELEEEINSNSKFKKLAQIALTVRGGFIKYYLQSHYLMPMVFAMFLTSLAWIVLHECPGYGSLKNRYIACLFCILAITQNEVSFMIKRKKRNRLIDEEDEKRIDIEFQLTDLYDKIRKKRKGKNKKS